MQDNINFTDQNGDLPTFDSAPQQDQAIAFDPTPQKDPIPTFNPSSQDNLVPSFDPAPQQDPIPSFSSNAEISFAPQEKDLFFEEPVEEVKIEDKRHPEVDEKVDSAFFKALASTILAFFPITSVVAIFLGLSVSKKLKEANELAENYGVGLGGKAKAAKILSIIGSIAGGVFTVYYAFYAFIILISIFFYIINILNGLFTAINTLSKYADVFDRFLDVYYELSELFNYWF